MWAIVSQHLHGTLTYEHHGYIRYKEDDVVRNVTPNTLTRSPGTTTLSSWLSPMSGDWHAMAHAFNTVDTYDKWVRKPQAIKYLSDATNVAQSDGDCNFRVIFEVARHHSSGIICFREINHH